MTTARERREFDERQKEATRQLAGRAYLIWREWWRPLRNRRLRREAQEIWRTADEDYRRFRDAT